jgi:hypothetical protein
VSFKQQSLTHFVALSYKTDENIFRARLFKLQKGCTRLASDKVYQLPAHGQWFSSGTPASSTTKTGRHHIEDNNLF